MHFVFGNELIISAVDGIEALAWWNGPRCQALLMALQNDSIWPLGGGLNIVMLYSPHLNLFSLFSSVLIGLSLPLLCGIPLTLSPRIKILINLSVSLSSYHWEGKEETEEERVLCYMGSWDARHATAGGTVSVASTAAMLLSAEPLPHSACSVSEFVSVCLCDEPSWALIRHKSSWYSSERDLMLWSWPKIKISSHFTWEGELRVWMLAIIRVHGRRRWLVNVVWSCGSPS